MSNVLTMPCCDLGAFTEPLAALADNATRRPKPTHVHRGLPIVPPRATNDADGVPVLAYLCDPRTPNLLGPLPDLLAVRAVEFRVCRIHWRPNPDHPYYLVPCPRDLMGESYPFATANIHQIVLQLGGMAVGVCDEERVVFAPETYPSLVVADVNDRVKYDNDGHYEVWVYRFYT